MNRSRVRELSYLAVRQRALNNWGDPVRYDVKIIPDPSGRNELWRK